MWYQPLCILRASHGRSRHLPVCSRQTTWRLLPAAVKFPPEYNGKCSHTGLAAGLRSAATESQPQGFVAGRWISERYQYISFPPLEIRRASFPSADLTCRFVTCTLHPALGIAQRSVFHVLRRV